MLNVARRQKLFHKPRERLEERVSNSNWIIRTEFKCIQRCPNELLAFARQKLLGEKLLQCRCQEEELFPSVDTFTSAVALQDVEHQRSVGSELEFLHQRTIMQRQSELNSKRTQFYLKFYNKVKGWK